MSEVEIAINGLTNIDAMELQGAIAGKKLEALSLTFAKEPPSPGRYHDPALAAALIKIAIDNAPVVLPTLASAIAIWIAKGKKANRVKDKTIDISWRGVKIATYEATAFQESDGTKVLEKLKQTSQTPSA